MEVTPHDITSSSTPQKLRSQALEACNEQHQRKRTSKGQKSLKSLAEIIPLGISQLDECLRAGAGQDASAADDTASRRGRGQCNPTGAAAGVNEPAQAARRGCEAEAFTSITRDAGQAHARRGAGDDDRGEVDR